MIFMSHFLNAVLQACALSLLETSVFHVDVAEAVADTGPDLVDYCVRFPLPYDTILNTGYWILILNADTGCWILDADTGC